MDESEPVNLAACGSAGEVRVKALVLSLLMRRAVVGAGGRTKGRVEGGEREGEILDATGRIKE